jgi:hypothetical protein
LSEGYFSCFNEIFYTLLGGNQHMKNYDQNKEDGNQHHSNTNNATKTKTRTNKFLLLGSMIILLVSASALGLLLSNGKKDTPITGVQSPNGEQAQSKSNHGKKTPEETINAFLSAVQNKDYETAATYISENAKATNKKLGRNPANWLYQHFSSEPLIDFSIKRIEDTETKDKKNVVADLTVQGFGITQAHGYYSLELENGIWKVNPN